MKTNLKGYFLISEAAAFIGVSEGTLRNSGRQGKIVTHRQPTPPRERLQGLPRAVSAIILKLLAKTAEDRYQTAAGAGSDLQRCLHEWETQNRIDDFPLGERDTPNRLLIQEKLYGRESEIDALLASFGDKSTWAERSPSIF